MVFQFHKGAIRTVYGHGNILAYHHFNSIKVRLELRFFDYDRGDNYHFNSIKVRLERGKACVFGERISISIP